MYLAANFYSSANLGRFVLAVKVHLLQVITNQVDQVLHRELLEYT